MVKVSPIRWRKKDEDLLKKAIRNFNAKIRRIIKKEGPSAALYLPQPVKYRDVKKDIGTRSDFNRQVERLQRFTKKGLEKKVTTPQGIITTKWKYTEMQKMVDKVNKSRQQYREQHKVEPKPQRMGTPIENETRPIGEWPTPTMEDFEAFYRMLRKHERETYNEEKTEIFIDNYVRAVRKVFGSKGDPIIIYVKSMDPDAFVDLYYDEPDLDFEYIYGPDELETILERVIGIFMRWYEERDLAPPVIPEEMLKNITDQFITEADQREATRESQRKAEGKRKTTKGRWRKRPSSDAEKEEILRRRYGKAKI